MSATNRPPSVYVDDVFEEVLALPPEEREAAIEARCAGHPSLATEVRTLLAAEAAAPQPPADLVRAGATLGRYTLDTCLGKGASASVWKAWDTHLRTWTALKLLRPDLRRREDALHTALHEARAASAIISDHVVRIKSAGKLAAGPYYVEMQLCAEHEPDAEGHEDLVIGRTLAEERPRSMREAVRLVMEAARGVESAHRVGVLHRDIKPANILLMPISRRALVADFGLSAAHLYPAPAPGTPSTATITIHLHDGRGLLVGTPSFMPPEQAWGEPATRAADVYALGATLYALIARRAPFQPENQRPLPALDVVRMVREGPPLPLGEVAQGVPGQLQRIVARAMARDPAERYPTAAELAADLKLYLENRPTSVDGRRPWLNVGLFVRRHAPLVGAATLMTLMLAVSVTSVGLLENRRVQLTREVATAETRLLEARDEASQAERIRAAAVATRDLALGERDAALTEKDNAERARAAAQQGETKAMALARKELAARQAAEQERTAAQAARIEAEEELQRIRQVRVSLEAELERARGSLTEAEARVAQLDDQLRSEMSENKQLEKELELLGDQVMDQRARIAMLETELQLASAGATAAQEALDEASEAAPWMNPEATVSDPPEESPVAAP